MKLSILCLILGVSLALGIPEPPENLFFNLNKPPPIVAPNPFARAPSLLTIKMKVDNFNPSDTRTWNMRYYANPQHFIQGGPIFIYLGGEWEIEPNAISGGQIYDMAREHRGYLFYTEHRYYGQSYPTSDFSTANLKYLSVDQGIADVAEFVRQMKRNPMFTDSKVVVVGGSYAGTMATFLRMKYPDVIDAAYASSAPLLALDDFKQYFEVVGTNLNLASPNCYSTIRAATKYMEELYTTANGRQYLTSLFNSCRPLSAAFPYKDYVFNSIANLFAGVVQNARPGSILRECNTLLSNAGTPIEQLAAYVRGRTGSCMGSYDDLLYWYSQTGLSRNMYRQWFYQTCSEFGFFQTGNSNQQPFGVNWFSSVSHSFCKDAFGSEFTEQRILDGIDNTNYKYGALNPDITKVVSVHGKVDPWHSIGILEDLHEDAPVYVVPDTSHCADLASISSSDSPAMQNAKQKAKDYIKKWLNES